MSAQEQSFKPSKESHSNLTETFQAKRTKCCPYQETGKHLFPAEKPHMDSYYRNEILNKLPVPTLCQEQKKITVKPDKLLRKSENIPQIEKNNEKLAVDKSKSTGQRSLNRIVPCTPSREAILCAQDCPEPLCRREWGIEAATLDGNQANPSFSNQCAGATANPKKTCNRKSAFQNQ